MKTRKQLKKESANAEYRALIHFRKLNAIEEIIAKGEEEKQPYFYIVDKIKEVICRQN